MSLIKQQFALNEEFQLCTITQLQHEDYNSWTWLGRELTSWNDDNNETYDLDKSLKFNRSLVNMSANWVLTKHPISASIPSEHGYVKITLENTELPLATTEQPYTTSYILSNEQVGNIWYDSKLSIDLVPDDDYKATEFIINNNIVSPSVHWIYTNETTNKTKDKSFNIYAKFDVDEVQPEEPETPTDLTEPLCFTAEDPGATITLNKVEDVDDMSFVTSTNKYNWTPYKFGTKITLANVGDKVYFRAADDAMNNTYGYQFGTTKNKRIAASGNLNTLLKADGSVIDLTGRAWCFAYLFRDCTSLTKAPELPATTLDQYCYYQMFKNCTYLTKAPELPATTLAKCCYNRMFTGCSNLNNINVNFSAWNPSDATIDWVVNVASSGTFTCPMDLPQEFGNNRIPTGWRVLTPNMIEPLCFTAEEPKATLSLTKNDVAPYDAKIVVSTDKQNWSNYKFGTKITLANIGDKVYFRAPDGRINSLFNGYQFDINNGKIAASGNLNTLLKADGSINNLTGKDQCYAYLFSGCTSLTQAPELPAETLGWHCYSHMFYNCSSLTQAPKLPATTLDNQCYWYMFAGCTSLTAAPELPATTLAIGCYRGMFSGCRSLTQAPELPAETLDWHCYSHMFYNCSSLTQAPKLPATTLANSCYSGMFSGCTSLTQAPELPATILKNGCYNEMFKNCSNLTSINVNFSDWMPNNYDCTNNWVNGVASSGIFVCPKMLYILEDNSGVPFGWTVKTK